MLSWLHRFAGNRVRRELAQTRAELESAKRQIEVLESQVECQALVIVREQERIKAETAIHAARRAKAEGTADGERTLKS